MAFKLLRNLTGRDLHVTISQPGFESLLASNIGSDFGPQDGFDEQVSSVASALGDDDNTGAALDQHLNDAGFSPGQIAPVLYGPAASDTNDFITAGDAGIDFLTTTAEVPGGAPSCTPTPANPEPCGPVSFGRGEAEL